MKEISITKGMIAIVDDIDFEYLSLLKWSYTRCGYARIKKKVVNHYESYYMHRLVMAAPRGMQVDHINGNKLDNRRSNLRLTTNMFNIANRPVSIRNQSGYKGVSWFTKTRKWRAFIRVKGKGVSLGLYIDKIDAARAYNEAAVKYFGEFAYLNKVGGGEKVL